MGTNEDILREIIGHSLLLRVGAHAIAIIKQRVADGIFENGSTSGTDKYSTKPFAMPIGAIQKKDVLLKILKDKYDPETETQIFTTKAGKKWVVIKKGYEWLRAQSGKPSTKVDMRWTGEMMRSLKVLDANPVTGELTIGHDGARNDQLAQWHHQGAGRSKVIRRWLYLTDDELNSLAGME
jgi:hypothetical protein